MTWLTCMRHDLTLRHAKCDAARLESLFDWRGSSGACEIASDTSHRRIRRGRNGLRGAAAGCVNLIVG